MLTDIENTRLGGGARKLLEVDKTPEVHVKLATYVIPVVAMTVPPGGDVCVTVKVQIWFDPAGPLLLSTNV
jgi:hypothetical protein